MSNWERLAMFESYISIDKPFSIIVWHSHTDIWNDIIFKYIILK